MARSRKQSPERTLKRLLLSGNTAAAEKLLQQLLQDNPQHEWAADELERLRAGKQLRVMEDAETRHRRLCAETLGAINKLLKLHPDSSLTSRTADELKELRDKLKQLLKDAERLKLQDIPSTTPLLLAINAELTKHRKRNMKRLMPRIAVVALLVALASGGWYHCRNRAGDMEQELRTAVELARWEKVNATVKVVDTSFYRLINPGIETAIQLANQWITTTHNRKERIERQLTHIENNGIRVSAMALTDRGLIERDLEALPSELSAPLNKRWQALCSVEEQELQQQKAEFLQQLQAPLPPPPTYTSDTESDLASVQQQIDDFNLRLWQFENAPVSYKLPPQLISPVKERLQQLRRCEDEIRAYRLLVAGMKRCRTYSQHRTALQEYAPSVYTPAVNLMRISPYLPPEENVKSALQAAGYKVIDKARQAAAVQTLLKGGPTFTPAYPATIEQIHLVENLFTAPSLYRRIYEITRSNGETGYTEKVPKVDVGDNRIYFTRSDLDPELNINNRKVCWEDIDRVSIHTLDAGHLMRSLKLQKEDFFLKANIAQLLTQVLNFRHAECPALAQAYVYYTLLSLLDIHQHPQMTGVRYSPTMRRHASEFTSLAKQLGLKLSHPGGWLGNTPTGNKAEQAFRDWFAGHRGTDYCNEIKQNFGPLVRVGLQYCGYINTEGKAVIFRQLDADTPIWYMTDDGFESTAYGTEPQNASPFSPIFSAL